jgi:flagellar hook-basal body protein
MQRGVYSAGAAMLNAQAQLDVIAQNLANASTTGFKRDGIAFNEALMRTMADFGGNGRNLGEMGAVQAMNVKYTDMEQGTLQVTGNPLDVAIQEEGMFAVQTDQGVRYTRAGSFTLDNTGRLVPYWTSDRRSADYRSR